MNRFLARIFVLALSASTVVAAHASSGGRARIGSRTKEPYLGAIVVDADVGTVIFEDHADEVGYPASVIKLMDMLIIQDRIKAGTLHLEDIVTTTREAAQIGGTQVFLKEKEIFPVEDLLYAIMIQSANDAATALSIHIAGSTTGFVELMNKRAQGLGMEATRFHSVHGLPPSTGEDPDVSTPRDLTRLAREILKYPDVLKYTSTLERGFRGGAFIMRTHDHLLRSVPGCDGLKTGFISAGGFSIVATAQRGGRRIIAVLMGCPTRVGRDKVAAELIEKGFMNLPPLPPPPPPPAPEKHALPVKDTASQWRWIIKVCMLAAGAVLLLVVGIIIGKRKS